MNKLYQRLNEIENELATTKGGEWYITVLLEEHQRIMKRIKLIGKKEEANISQDREEILQE